MPKKKKIKAATYLLFKLLKTKVKDSNWYKTLKSLNMVIGNFIHSKILVWSSI